MTEQFVDVIREGEVYSKEEFMRRTKMKSWAYYAALKKGLRHIQTGGRSFVLGSDWIRYLERIGVDLSPEITVSEETEKLLSA